MLELTNDVFLVTANQEVGEKISGFKNGCSTYLVRDEEGRGILIDPGDANTFPQLVGHLEKNGFPLSKIQVIGTHYHHDHIGSAYLFQKEGVSAATSNLTAKTVGIQLDRNKDYGDMPEELRGTDNPFTPDETFSDGETFRAGTLEFSVYNTPGHVVDNHTLFLNRNGEKILFAGDLLGYLNYVTNRGSFPDMLASVKKARALQASLLCFGHYTIYKDADLYWDRVQKNLEHGSYMFTDSTGERGQRVKAVLGMVEHFQANPVS